MASTYSKLDLKGFKERLTAKHYANATGARRGVGKSEMSDADKTSAYAAIDKHFGVEAKPAKTSAVTAKRQPAKRTTAAVKGATAKPKTAARAKKTSAKKTSARGRKAADADGAPATQELADLHAGASATQAAMAGLATASELDPGLDVKASVQQGAEILQHSINRIGELLGHNPKSFVVTSAVGPLLVSVPVVHDEGTEPDEDDEEPSS